MHKLIYLMVEAEDEESAWEKLKCMRDMLTNTKYFDYGTFFNEDGGQVSGSARWGKIQAISKIKSAVGKKYLAKAQNSIKNQFTESLNEIRKCLDNYTDLEIFEQKITDPKSQVVEAIRNPEYSTNKSNFDLELFRYHCRRMLGDGCSGWLFIYEDGAVYPVEGNYSGGDNIWIAPLDVHY